MDRVRLSLGVGYEKRDNWLLWQGDDNYSGFASERWGPNITFESFFTARQQLTFRLQWVAIWAHEVGRYRVEHNRPLVPLGAPTVGQTRGLPLAIQLRYRWQIAPMSNLFVVYNRGGGLPGASTGVGFSDLFSDTLSARVRKGRAMWRLLTMS